jgi:hypothetical protein
MPDTLLLAMALAPLGTLFFSTGRHYMEIGTLAPGESKTIPWPPAD